MEVIAEKDIEVVIDSVGEVSTDSALEVDVIDNTELAVSVNRKEFNIVGDELYIPKRYEDAPQWLRDLISKVTEESYARKITDLNNLSTSLKQLIIELDVAKNTYTQSIISSNDIDERINTAVTTLNSSLSKSDATIVDLISTKATPSEASAIALNVISSSINDGEIGALVGSVKNTLTTETEVLANNIDLVHAEMSKGFEGTADAIQITRAYVGIDENGGTTGTGLLASVSILQKQNDGIIETVADTYDVMINPQDPNLAELVLTAEPYASWKAKDVSGIDTRLAHIGDVYVKYRTTSNGAREYLASFKFIRTIVDASDAHKSTDADGFTWALIVDQASQDAYTQALNARDLADGKRRVFVGLGATTTPSVPYDQGDLWLIDVARTVNGYQCKVGDILRCVETKKADIGSYEQNDWVIASSYANAVEAQNQLFQNFVNNDYATFVSNIQSQVDTKAETFYRSSVPEGRIKSINVADNDTLNKYVGDLWKNTYVGTVSGYLGNNTEYIYTKKPNGSNWDYDWVKMEVPDIVFDTIDTKKSIYTGNSIPVAVAPDVIETNDMWITGDAPVSPYLAKSIYIWNSDEAKWVMPVRYTDDQYARSIVDGTSQIDLSQHINSLGWTDDSTIDDFIVGTYAKDLLNIGNQVDGVAVTYFQNDAPYLASAGTSANSGDVWYDTNASTPTAYKFKYKTLGSDGVTVISPSEWTIITNAFVLSSLTAASKTKAAADRSIKNYTSTPVTPYYNGDTWMQGSTGDIYVCNVERLTGAFNQSDWIIASKYTNDSRVIQLENGIADGSIAFNLNSAVVGGKPLTTYVADEIDKEVVVYSGTNHLDYSSLGSLKPNDLYIEKTTAVGTSGVAVDVLNTWKCLTVSPTAGVVTSATWLQIGNNNNITALADLADGKRTVFSGNTVPVGAVARDIWIPSADVAITTSAMCTVAGGTWTTVCNIPKYLSGEIYQFSSTGKWLLATKYSANLESVRSSLQTQVDGKIMTTYGGATPPIQNQTEFGPKSANKDDYWYCDTNGAYEKGKVYKYEETEGTGADSGKFKYMWKFSSDISREAFDLADGKSAIFTTESKPSVYSKNDMMIVTGTFNNGTTEFSDGVVLTATADSTSFVAAHWVKKINDTEDLDAYKKVVNPQLTSLQNQVDGKIESWYVPSTDNPNSEWIDSATRDKHDGDMWYQTDTKLSYYYSSSSDSWNLIEDAKAIQALTNAETAQAAADGVVVSYYAIRQDTQPDFSKLWFHKITVGDELKYVLQKYEESSWVNVDVKQGDTLTTYDTVTKDTSIYLYHSGNWVTEIENGIVAESSAVTKLKAYLGTDGGTSTLVNDITSKSNALGKSVDSRFAYNSNIVLNGVSYQSGFGLATNLTSGGSDLPTGQSEFWIKADKFKLMSADGNKKSSYSPFTVDSVTGEISFNGKVTFSNVTGTPGTGSNILTNSAPKIGSETKGWSTWTNSGMTVALTGGWNEWKPTGGASIAARISGSPSIGTLFDIRQGSIPVIAGKRYEASAYISAHRTNSYVLVVFYSASGENIGQATGNIVNFAGSDALVNWGRSSVFVTAPSNAAIASYIIRSQVTGIDPYCFASYGFLGIAEANQTTPSNWSEGIGVGVSSSEVVSDINSGNTTTINGGRITTGSITANQIQANSVSADRLLAGTNSTTVWTGGGLVSSNFNGNSYGNIGSPTAGFRLSSNAAGTTADPNIYGAYIKGGTVEGTAFLYSTNTVGNFAPYYYNEYKYLNFTIDASASGTVYTPVIQLISPSYSSGLLSNRVKNLSTSVITIDTTGAVSQLFADNYINTEIQISRDGGSYTKLDGMTTAEGVNKMYVGTITGYSNYINLRLQISYGNSGTTAYQTAAALKVHLDNTAV